MLNFIAYKIDRFRFYIRLNAISTQLLLLLPLLFFLYENHRLAIITLVVCLVLIIISILGKRGSRLSNYIIYNTEDYDDFRDEYYLFLERLSLLENKDLDKIEVVNTSSLFVKNYIKFLVHKRINFVYRFIIPSYMFIVLILLFTMFPEVREGIRIFIGSILFSILLWSPIFGMFLIRLERKDTYEDFEGNYTDFEEFEMLRQFNSGIIDANTYDKYMEIEAKS